MTSKGGLASPSVLILLVSTRTTERAWNKAPHRHDKSVNEQYHHADVEEPRKREFRREKHRDSERRAQNKDAATLSWRKHKHSLSRDVALSK